MHFKVQLTYIECVRGIYIYILRFKASTAARRYVTVSARITFERETCTGPLQRPSSHSTRLP